jgi:hypothetical protein
MKLARLGLIDGRNLHVDQRWGNDDLDRIRMFAKELIELKPDAVLATRDCVAAGACSRAQPRGAYSGRIRRDPSRDRSRLPDAGVPQRPSPRPTLTPAC